LEGGVVAGFPVEDVRVIVYDGKTHPVDGKEVAFVQAGKKATIAAVQAAAPVVLEPIVKIAVDVDEDQMGDIAGDLSSRRGHVTGTAPRGVGRVAISGEVPLAEIGDYASRLKSMTGGRGSYTIEFSHYAQVPPPVQQKLAASFKLKEDEE
ncbi:MAG: elongation factor G, partial [Rhodocyclaceae bacterium]